MFVKRKAAITLVLVAVPLLALSACGGAAGEPVEEAGSELADTAGGEVPAPDVEPPDPFTDIEMFMAYLESLLQDPNRDAQELMGTMGESFMIGGWQAEAMELTPDAAIAELLDLHLSSEGGVQGFTFPNWEEYLDADMEAMFPNAAQVVLCEGWGYYGDAEAIILIEMGPDDRYYWAGAVVVEGGFNPEPDPFTDIEEFMAYLESLLQDPNRDAQELMGTMGESFMIGGWQAGAMEYTPSEAIAELLDLHLSSEGGVRGFAYPDWEAYLGTDVEAMFPDAAQVILCEGWGYYGDAQSIIIIELGPDGRYYWSGVVVAEGGFAAG